ncbi:MAG: type II toxin-antitoxin system VapC family toxin [Caldilineaceae bacterium]|nr:type II toxin-antitoxin system VapC family toxin [Caldilineaceae bacterium]
MTAFVDTNIFLRFLTRDDPEKAEACQTLFQRARSGEADLVTSESVIAEVVFVLSSPRLYDLSRQDIRARLYPLLTLPGLRLPQRETCLHALELYAAFPVDFEDALTTAHMHRQNIAELYSYDKDFDRLPNVNRIEPL